MHNAVLAMTMIAVMYNIAYEISGKRNLRNGRTIWIVGAFIALLIQIAMKF